MTQWKKLLKSLGFSDSESVIYLASLEMGPSSVQDIAKKAGVSRVTTYAVIESLSSQGLMSSVEKGKKHLFVAEAPERVVSFIQSKMKDMEATLKEVESSINDLKLLQRGEKPIVKLFEGAEGRKAIEDDMLLTRPDQIDEFGNFDDAMRIHPPAERAPFHTEFAKIKPKRHLMMFLSKEHNPVSRTPQQRVLAIPEQYNFHGDVMVYKNKIALSTFEGKQISVLIESSTLADTLRALMDMAAKAERK